MEVGRVWLFFFLKEIMSGKRDRQELNEHFWGVELLVFSSVAISNRHVLASDLGTVGQIR